jgi:zinc-binding dehydrogenase
MPLSSPSSHSLIYSNKLAFIVVSIIICALVVDTSIIKVYYLNVQQLSSSISSVIMFIIISSIYMVGQYFVLGYLNKKSREVGDYNKKLRIKALHKALAIVQYVLIAINIFVIVQMFIISRYSVASLIAVCGLGHMAVKIAHAFGAHFVVFTTSPNKKEDALRLGADEVVISRNTDEMSKYVNSFDFILDAVPAEHDINSYLRLLRRDGNMDPRWRTGQASCRGGL